jgi:Arc/MetJ-type ribon-helix-helix transcriptional regulator
MYTMKEKQLAIPVKLTPQLTREIDELVRLGVFASRSEAIRFGVRLMILMERADIPISRRAEEYAYEDIKGKLERIKNVRRS